jgi:dihydrofolate reductase
VSLDGVVQAPGGPGEDDDGGFAHGGWTVPFFDEHLGEVMGAFMGKPFDLVLGRRTYDIFAAYWPTASEAGGGARRSTTRPSTSPRAAARSSRGTAPSSSRATSSTACAR